MAKPQHVFARPDGTWSVRSTGASKAKKSFGTKNEAISYARVIAKVNLTDLYVHGRDGMIREHANYGRDPIPPKG